MLKFAQEPPIAAFPSKRFGFSVVLEDVRRNAAALAGVASVQFDVIAVEAVELSGGRRGASESIVPIPNAVTVLSPPNLALPVREGDSPLPVTVQLNVSAEQLQGKRVQLQLVARLAAVRPALSKQPGIFVAPYAPVLLSTPELPGDAMSVADAGLPAPPVQQAVFDETQVGLVPVDPEDDSHLLRSWVYLPNLFFKDEGSKDRCMEAEVALVAADPDHPSGPPKLVKGIKLHVRVMLLYSDFTLAPEYCSSGGRRRAGGTQLLHVSNGTVRHIDPDTGRTKVKFRVNDVSKNHDGRPFRLAVFADLSDDTSAAATSAIDGPVIASHVAPAFSHAIEVRSKRRKPKKGGSSDADSESQVGGYAEMHTRGLAGPTNGARPATKLATPAAAGAGAGRPAGRPRGLGHAMNEVINWTNSVLDLLQHTLQWQQYPTSAGPRFRCPVCATEVATIAPGVQHKPECTLSRCISRYASTTRQALTSLVQHVHGEDKMREAQQKAAAKAPVHTGASTAAPSTMTSSAADQAFSVVESLVNLRNSPVESSTAPPDLSRDESVGTMFRRRAGEQDAGSGGGGARIQPPPGPLSSSSGGSLADLSTPGVTVNSAPVGDVKRGLESSGFGGTAAGAVATTAHKRAALVDAVPAHLLRAPSAPMGVPMPPPGPAPALMRGGSADSHHSVGSDLGGVAMAGAMPPYSRHYGGMPGMPAPPMHPQLMMQPSLTAQNSTGGDGWLVDLQRQDSAHGAPQGGQPGRGMHPRANVRGMPPPPAANAPFFRGNSQSSLMSEG